MANRPPKRRFVLVHQDALCELAKDPDLTGTAFRVLAYMLSEVDLQNAIHLTQADIARELDTTPSEVSIQIKNLIKKGIFERIPLKQKAKGRGTAFQPSRKIGWKGYNRQEDAEQKVNDTDVRSATDNPSDHQ